MGAHTQRRDERNVQLGETANGRKIQVVVMVVGDQHHVDRGKLGHFDGHWLKALRTRESNRRCTIAPDGIRQHPGAIDLHQHRRMTEPGGAESRFTRPRPSRKRVHGRQWATRYSTLPTEKELPDRRSGRSSLEPWHHSARIAKDAIRPAGRGLDPFQTKTCRAGSER